MPSSMFLPAATPEKDGNSAAEELGKQPGECGSHQLVRDCVRARVRLGELPVSRCLLKPAVRWCPAEPSPFTCVVAVPWVTHGRAEQGDSAEEHSSPPW